MTDAVDNDLDQILEQYAKAASAHGRAIESGDHREANRAADNVAAVYRAIRGLGGMAQRALLQFLNSPDPGVRLWAGSHALEFAPQDGERALSSLQGAPEALLAFTAQMTLTEWREGKLKFV